MHLGENPNGKALEPSPLDPVTADFTIPGTPSDSPSGVVQRISAEEVQATLQRLMETEKEE